MAAQTLSPPKNIWSALRAAKEKAALSGDNLQLVLLWYLSTISLEPILARSAEPGPAA